MAKAQSEEGVRNVRLKLLVLGVLCLLPGLGAAQMAWNDQSWLPLALYPAVSLISLLLYRYAFDLQWSPHPWLLVLPLTGALLVGGAGVLGTRRALNASPLAVLREA